MGEPFLRRPFHTTSPSKRRNLKIQHILEDSILGGPHVTIPASRRPALGEVKNSASVVDRPKNAPKRSRRRGEFEIYQDAEEQTRKMQGSLSSPTEQPARPRSRALPPAPPLRQPPSTLTSLLLSHMHTPPPPHLPPPPRSRQSRQTPLEAASSMVPPELPPHTQSTPLHLLRQLRESLIAAASRTNPPQRPQPPPQRSQPPPRPHTPRPRTPHEAPVANTFSLTSLPPLTHHSEHAIITLHPPTHLTLLLRGSNYTYTMHPTPPTATIAIQDRLTNTHRAYALEDLPYKHLPAYRYARRFLAAVRRRTLLAYGEIEGAQGRVWADGRGVVAVAGGVEVEFPSGRVVAKERVEDEKRVVEGAREVYEWLLKHPGPIFLEKEDADAEWNLTPDARFVKGVGWCREVGTGRWSMKFLDGVGLEIGGSEVVWVEPGGGKRRVERGIKDEGVRARVVEFVKAGL